MAKTIELDLENDPNAVIALRAYAESYRKTDPKRREELLAIAREAEVGFEVKRVLQVRAACVAKLSGLGATEAMVEEIQKKRAIGDRSCATDARAKLPQPERLVHEFLDNPGV